MPLSTASTIQQLRLASYRVGRLAEQLDLDEGTNARRDVLWVARASRTADVCALPSLQTRVFIGGLGSRNQRSATHATNGARYTHVQSCLAIRWH